MLSTNPTPDQVSDSEWLIRKFMQQLPSEDIVFEGDAHFSITHVSASFLNLFGSNGPPKPRPASSLKALVHQNDWDRVARVLGGVVPGQPGTSVLFRASEPYDPSKWLWLSAKAIFDSKHQFLRFEGTLKDLTAQKSALDDLQTNEQFYEHILSTMPVQLVVFNEEQRYIFCNKTAIADDYLRNWIIGKDDFEFCRFRGKDINIAWQRRYYFQQALAYRQEIKWEEEIWKDEETKVVHLRRFTPIFDDAGVLQFVLGYGFDITSRVLAEERAAANENLLQSINANIQDGIYRYSPKKGFLYVNDAFLRIFEYPSLKALNEAGDDFFEQDPEGRYVLTAIEGTQGSFNNREVPFWYNNLQNRFWGLVSCNKTNDPQEGIVYDGVIADITEFKEAEELLKKTNEQLRQKNSDLDRFIYSASHDLRAPLTSIQGVLQLAELDGPDATMQHYLDLIKSSVYKLENFVNDLIDYYRNAKTQQSYNLIDFNDLVHTTFEHFQYMEGADRIQLHVENLMNENFQSDRYRLGIIVSNLLSNAIKYSDPEEPNPYIRARLERCGQHVCMEVEDNGQGIPEDQLEKVWDIFYRGNASGQGSGMGLFIVKETVEKLGGTINVDAQPGKGSTFRLTLPK